MATVIYDDASIRIPAWVVDLASFRRWTDSEEFPEEGRIYYLQGEVWVDMSREQLYTHNLVKTELTMVLSKLVKVNRWGLFFSDGARLTNVPADLSAVPDGVFLSDEALDAGRVRLVEGRDAGFTEIEGAPDLVIEVVSDSSVDKDTEWQPRAYWEAGIREYWLIDARKGPLKFDIFRHTAKGFVTTRKQGGWVKSAVLGHTFRLTQSADPRGRPECTLEVR
jgi:Uma2 family endonuclease